MGYEKRFVLGVIMGDQVRFCSKCGKECKTGQAMWNGGFKGMGLYHYECAPKEALESPKKSKVKIESPTRHFKSNKEQPLWAKYSTEEVGRNGLVDPDGRFYPCPFTGHNDLWETLRSAGLPESELESEKKWVKVSTGIFFGVTVFVMNGDRLTARQKLTVEKIAVQEQDYLFKDNSWINVGYGDILTYDKETGKLKWERQ